MGGHKGAIRYQRLPPDGGWGYLVMMALAIALVVTFVPMTGFGLVYGAFLKSLGDETTGTTLANGLFNTVFNFTGLAANSLLQRYSCRVVAFMGAAIFFLGAFSILVVNSLFQFIVSFGVIQGLGMGLVFPAFFTALNNYFDKRLNLMNSIAQTIMVAASMACPVLIKYILDEYMYKGTVAILAAISLHTLVMAALLQPVEWHMKRVPIDPEDMSQLSSSNHSLELQPQLKPLLETVVEEGSSEISYSYKPRASIISIGDRAISVTTLNQIGKPHSEGFLKTFLNSFDLSLLKQPSYLNMSVGLSLAFTADIGFIALIPLLLKESGQTPAETALALTAFFGADLVARIILSVINGIWRVNNRYVLLGGALISIFFRIAFVMRDTFLWKLTTISILGFLRCFVQTPLPLVISDQYSDNFSSAFSLYMVVCGFVSLAFGPLQSWVKSTTHSDIMVVHLLTLAFTVCCVSWIVELAYKKMKKKNEGQPK